MTIINQKSISGITSVTFASAGDDLLTFHSNNGTERFRIDNSGNTKITAGIVTTLTVTGNGTVGGTLGVTGDVDIADKIVHTGDTNTAIRFPAADTVTVETGGSERVRVDSSGDYLFLGGTLRIKNAANDTQYAALYADASNFHVNAGVNNLLLYTGGGERARIDSSGQLGIGTVSPARNLHVHGSDSDTVQVHLTNSTTGPTSNDGFSVVLGSDESAILNMRENNPMRFFTNDSERMRIDTDGRLLVGATTARANFYNNASGVETRLQVEGTTFTTSSAALVRNSNNASDAELVLAKSRGTSVGSNTVVQSGDSLGAISFQGSDGSEFVEAASITAVVDSTPGSNDMPGRISFSVTSDGASSTTERLRINKLGFVKAGPRITDGSHGVASLTSARHEFTSDNNGWTMIVTHTSGAASEHEGILIDYAGSPNGTGNSFLQGNDSNGTRFRVASNGGLYNYQSNDSNLSDEREKKNIVSLDTKWDKVKSWELKKFHYNEDADSDDLRYGVIAQQVEDHCPEVLSEWVKQEAKDAVLDEDGNVVTPAVAEVTRKGVKEQQMMWMAIKALQEAQTRIETLETQNTAQQTQINDLITRVTALEG